MSSHGHVPLYSTNSSDEGFPTALISPVANERNENELSNSSVILPKQAIIESDTSDQSASATEIYSGEICLIQEATKSVSRNSSETKDSDSLSKEFAASPGPHRRKDFDFWGELPYEIALHILANLTPKELVRASIISKNFSKICYDGQLWTSFDASRFYKEISAESLAKILEAAGPFVRDLNLRGCIQVEHYKRAEVVAKACNNLVNATLEGCRNFQRSTLHSLLKGNIKLVNLNLTGLSTVTNGTCKIIAKTCPSLETLDISWCTRMDARGIRIIIQECTKLKDLRASEIKGTSCLELAQVIFETNNLERLILSRCTDLTDQALQIMMHGKNPEIDVFTNAPSVPVRRLRYLDISRCYQISDAGIKALAHLTANLQGLQLNGCSHIGDEGLASVLATTPYLTHLDLEEVYRLTDDFFKDSIAKAPFASSLKHLSISYCDQISDAGMIPIFQACTSLQSVDMDNTNISDLVLTEAAIMLKSRSEFNERKAKKPVIGLRLVVYDCHNITWAGIREVLSHNTEFQKSSDNLGTTRMTKLIALKCYYCWQMTVDEHTKRLLRGDVPAAQRLEKLWADWLMANEEVGTDGPGMRRRRRRARGAQALHVNEEGGRTSVEESRRRNRLWNSGCTIM